MFHEWPPKRRWKKQSFKIVGWTLAHWYKIAIVHVQHHILYYRVNCNLLSFKSCRIQLPLRTLNSIVHPYVVRVAPVTFALPRNEDASFCVARLPKWPRTDIIIQWKVSFGRLWRPANCGWRSARSTIASLLLTTHTGLRPPAGLDAQVASATWY